MANDPGRISGNDSHWRHIPGNHCRGADDGTAAKTNTAQYRCRGRDPDIVFEHNRPVIEFDIARMPMLHDAAEVQMPLRRIERMGQAVENVTLWEIIARVPILIDAPDHMRVPDR